MGGTRVGAGGLLLDGWVARWGARIGAGGLSGWMGGGWHADRSRAPVIGAGGPQTRGADRSWASCATVPAVVSFDARPALSVCVASLCRVPALSVSGPGALCVEPESHRKSERAPGLETESAGATQRASGADRHSARCQHRERRVTARERQAFYPAAPSCSASRCFCALDGWQASPSEVVRM